MRHIIEFNNFVKLQNFQVGMAIVDGAIGSLPAQDKDKFWYEKHPTPLYSEKMAAVQVNPAVSAIFTPLMCYT